MKKTNTTNDLLEQLAQTKPVVKSQSEPVPEPVNMATYQPDSPPGMPKKSDSGCSKGIWLRLDELQTLNDTKRKLYFEGVEVTHNLIIRALIHDLPTNTRILDKILELKTQ